MIGVGICTNIDVRETILFWVQVISAVGAVAAVGFAAWTIAEAKKSAKASANALIRERRIDFELDVLRDLAEANQLPDGADWAAERVRVSAMLLSVEQAPWARAVSGLPSKPEINEAVDEMRRGLSHRDYLRRHFKSQINEEVVSAIQLLIDERG